MPFPTPFSAAPPGTRKADARRLAPAAVAALLLAACGYPDRDLRPPDRGLPAAAVPSEAAASGPGDFGPGDLGPGDFGLSDFGLGAPFVVIRFGPEPVEYEDALAGAVAEARAQRPNAKYHLLAVTAGGGPDLPRPAALDHAEAVLRSLAALGVPPDEVFVAAATAPDGLIDEVRLYLR